ncbi:hypothetical protein O7A70_09470 [Mesorhizobium sp. Cs1299R1N1]
MKYDTSLNPLIMAMSLTRMPARIHGTLTCLEPGLGALAATGRHRRP